MDSPHRPGNEFRKLAGELFSVLTDQCWPNELRRERVTTLATATSASEATVRDWLAGRWVPRASARLAITHVFAGRSVMCPGDLGARCLSALEKYSPNNRYHASIDKWLTPRPETMEPADYDFDGDFKPRVLTKPIDLQVNADFLSELWSRARLYALNDDGFGGHHPSQACLIWPVFVNRLEAGRIRGTVNVIVDPIGAGYVDVEVLRFRPSRAGQQLADEPTCIVRYNGRICFGRQFGHEPMLGNDRLLELQAGGDLWGAPYNSKVFPFDSRPIVDAEEMRLDNERGLQRRVAHHDGFFEYLTLRVPLQEVELLFVSEPPYEVTLNKLQKRIDELERRLSQDSPQQRSA